MSTLPVRNGEVGSRLRTAAQPQRCAMPWGVARHAATAVVPDLWGRHCAMLAHGHNRVRRRRSLACGSCNSQGCATRRGPPAPPRPTLISEGCRRLAHLAMRMPKCYAGCRTLGATPHPSPATQRTASAPLSASCPCNACMTSDQLFPGATATTPRAGT